MTPKSSAALVAPVVAASLVLTACAPAGGDGGDAGEDTPLVLATFTVLADMTSAVAGDHVEVRSITPPEAEVHQYDPTPQDVRSAAEADLIMENGLHLEEWFGQFIDHSQAPTVTLSDGVETQPVTHVPGHPDETAEEEMPTDPHAWMSPRRALTYVENIEEALSELAPEHAEDFAVNAEEYAGELEALISETEERVEAVDQPVHVVSCEGGFGYLATDFGLQEHYLWPVNADGEGTPQQVEAQIDYVQEHEVPRIFCESTVNPGPQEQVAEAAGAQLGDPLYVDSLSEDGGPVPSYLELLEYDIDLILEAAEADLHGDHD